eukprot:4870077-Pyramimonas_sp.AAC.1
MRYAHLEAKRRKVGDEGAVAAPTATQKVEVQEQLAAGATQEVAGQPTGREAKRKGAVQRPKQESQQRIEKARSTASASSTSRAAPADTQKDNGEDDAMGVAAGKDQSTL